LKNQYAEILHIGILGAMQEEIGNTINNLYNIEKKRYGDLTIVSGEIKIDKITKKKLFLSIAWSGWGKVSSARASTRLIGHKYKRTNIDFLLFTGVAGSVDSHVRQWDIIIADSLIQHDLDARPIFERFHIPVFNKDELSPKKEWLEWIFKTLNKNFESKKLKFFKNLYKGQIGTGDQFISNKKEILELKKNLPNLKAVEMEGGSVAQVAMQEGIPWVVIRVISDSADESASTDFSTFLKIYNKVSSNLIEVIAENYLKSPKFFNENNSIRIN
jgi:adenosylhomocysteine nucleosidase